MRIRSFTDTAGVDWRVRETVPTSRAAGTLPDAYARGWLVFESGTGVTRRLAPIPDGWHLATTEGLEDLCRSAVSSRERGDAPTAEVLRYDPTRRPAAGGQQG